MAEPVMKYGARKGKMSVMRRWIAQASARVIRIFPVPGADVLRIHQNELKSGFIIAPNPREANVLLVMGDLTDPLARKAAVAYQQIPRPRVLVVAGPEPPYLPKPDVHLSLRNDFFDKALPAVRELLKNHAWSEEAEPWEPEFLKDLVEDSDIGGGHDHHHHHGNGDEENGNEHDHGHEEHGGDHESHEHSGDHDHETEKHENEEDHEHENHDHNSHGHGGHDHGDMDFMSMVAMTKDLPRPKDGLPMNRSETHFGPFHPGLPGGLSVFTELDGDTVIKAHVEHGLVSRDLGSILPINAKNFSDFLSRLNLLSPQSYKLLGQKALENSAGLSGDLSSDELLLLEKERIGSHLNWLATFAKTIGNEWMHRRACKLYGTLNKNTLRQAPVSDLMKKVRQMPYLRNKLTKGNSIPENLLHRVSGPVAKAAGKKEDRRSQDDFYQKLGWEPVIMRENNAWGRLEVRLDEMKQSFELIRQVKERPKNHSKWTVPGSGKGSAQLEGPRGTLTLTMVIEEGTVTELKMETPSKALAGLVPTLCEEAELSDALVQIASLDISPWEMEFKEAGAPK